ncbi:MAG: hypothetical protein IJ814_04610 [Paludibacteraceae bacterium]|nr:hypothetical protein [Paludibacteraceae bacterium]
MTGFLGCIAALVMVWSVETKTAVSGSGDVPSQAAAEYSNTYQRGDVRAGDSAVFRLSGISGMTAERIEVYVKSNKSSGAGEIRLAIDGNSVTEISGTMAEWTGAYDNSASHPIELLDGIYRVGQEIAIVVKGTANSLHIEKYVLHYRTAAPCTVRLKAGEDEYMLLRESEAGGGVVLPNMADRNGWRFSGWSERDFQTMSVRPQLWTAGETYYPGENTVLWAVWEQPQNGEKPVSALQSGIYLYAYPEYNVALSGLPEDGKMENAPVRPYDSNQWYWFEFNERGDSVTIRHVDSDTYIGYTGSRLVRKKSVWQAVHAEGKTTVYMTNQGKNYILWPSMPDFDEEYAGLYNVSNVFALMSLIPVETEGMVYTCHPETADLEEVEEEGGGAAIVDFGIYEIHISKGKKYLRLRN